MPEGDVCDTLYVKIRCGGLHPRYGPAIFPRSCSKVLVLRRCCSEVIKRRASRIPCPFSSRTSATYQADRQVPVLPVCRTPAEDARTPSTITTRVHTPHIER
eukprot:Rmarinus@m.17737